MEPGDVAPVESYLDTYYVDTGMYATAEYGSVFIIDAERPAMIDTGIGTNHQYLLDALDEIGIARDELEVIAPTHVHLDHAGGAGYLAEECPNADVYIHEIGAPHLVDPSRLVEGTKRAVGGQWQHYVEPKPVPEDRIVELSGGDEIDLGDRVLDVIHAPGHAPHQVVFHDADAGGVFTADATGIYVPKLDVVRETTPPPNFDYEQCLADVETIRDLEPETLMYGHFGPYSGDVDAKLEEYEDVLDDWVDTVAAALDEYGDADAAAEYLAENAGMADLWGTEKAHEETKMNARGVLRYLKQSRD